MMMPDLEHARSASALLVGHWNPGTRLDAIPEDLRPATREDGYAIQAALVETTAAPLAGRLIAERAIENGATVSLATNLMRVAEVEFAFRFGQDLPPRAESYTVDEVLAAVA